MPERGPGRPLHCLLVDENQAHQSLLERSFQEIDQQARLLPAPTGDDALEKIKDAEVASRLDLVLLDLTLPGLPADQLIQRLKGRLQVPIVVLADLQTTRVVLGEAADLVDATSEKPVHADRLTNLLTELDLHRP